MRWCGSISDMRGARRSGLTSKFCLRHPAHGVNAIDYLLLAWSILLIGTSAFHTSDAWTFRIGMVLGELGVYFLCRVFIRDVEEVRRLFKIVCVALVPLAILMVLEKYT